MKRFLLKFIFFFVDIWFSIKLYRAKKMIELDEKLNDHIEEVVIERAAEAEVAESAEAPQPSPEKRRRKTELKALGGKVYRVEVDSGLVVEVDGEKIPKSERKPFSFYESGGVDEGSPSAASSEGRPLDIPADLLLNFAIVPINNYVASKTKDEAKLRIGDGENKDREKAARDLAELLSRYIADKTRVANPNEVILLTTAGLFVAPLAVSYATNRKDEDE